VRTADIHTFSSPVLLKFGHTDSDRKIPSSKMLFMHHAGMRDSHWSQ